MNPWNKKAWMRRHGRKYVDKGINELTEDDYWTLQFSKKYPGHVYIHRLFTNHILIYYCFYQGGREFIATRKVPFEEYEIAREQEGVYDFYNDILQDLHQKAKDKVRAAIIMYRLV